MNSPHLLSRSLLSVIAAFATLITCPMGAAAEPVTATDFQPLYTLPMGGDFGKGVALQRPHPESIAVVADPADASRKAVRITLARNDDYSKVANGAPRCEIAIGNGFRFERGKEYLVCWSTYLPANFAFDTKQIHAITQIHGGAPKGSPPFMLALNATNYEVQIRGGASGGKFVKSAAGDAEADRGKWVAWELRYVPDASGEKSVVELKRNREEFVTITGKPNAYPDDDKAYLKLGVYKWAWKRDPSDVERLELYYRDVSVAVKAAK